MTKPAASVGRGALEGFPTLTLAAGRLEAEIAPGAGMAGVSLRHAGDELLDRRGGLAAYAATGAVMGIPLLHPWANRLAAFDYAAGGRAVRLPDQSPLVRRDENGLPIHGLLGGAPQWQVRGVEADDGGARLAAQFDFAARPELLALFPFPHTLDLRVVLDGAGLTVTTTITATGLAPVPVAFGFHPYLRLPNLDRAEWRVALPARRRVLTDGRGIPTGDHEDQAAENEALGERTFDDGFDRIADGAEFAIAGGGRRITVTFVSGYPVGQVFSPPGARFVCFEPMTAPVNALVSGDGLRTVAPGDSLEAVFRIDVATG